MGRERYTPPQRHPPEPPSAVERLGLEKLNAILATQRRLLEKLEALGDETLPNQLFSLHGALADSINASQLAVLEAIGGLQLQCSTSDLLPLPEPGHTGDTAFCRIGVDIQNQVFESNEVNNTANGRCIRVG